MQRNSLCLYTDESLVAHSKEGATIAFEELVMRHNPALLRFLNYYCKSPHLAEEIAQEAFLRAWIKMKSFDSRASFKSWLFAIANNIFRDYLKSEKSRQNREANWAIESTLDSHVDKNDDAQFLRQVLAHFSPEIAAILELFYGQDFTHGEISDILNIPIGTVKSHINRARIKIAELIDAK